ncbi:MAG: hypothetical protein K1X48_03080 [Burkholderiaceae bacterium]|nr:hypothetical protein [Burkholderiaceae bacterium]
MEKLKIFLLFSVNFLIYWCILFFQFSGLIFFIFLITSPVFFDLHFMMLFVKSNLYMTAFFSLVFQLINIRESSLFKKLRPRKRLFFFTVQVLLGAVLLVVFYRIRHTLPERSVDEVSAQSLLFYGFTILWMLHGMGLRLYLQRKYPADVIPACA